MSLMTTTWKLSEIGTPLPLTVRSSIKFLQRIMEHERGAEEEPTMLEPEDGQKEEEGSDEPSRQPMLLAFLCELGQEKELFRKDLTIPACETWMNLVEYVEKHLADLPKDHSLWRQWRHIVSLPDRVAMVSVLNKNPA